MRTFALTAFALAAAAPTARAADPALEGRWTEAQANAWYAKRPWLVGCNYNPSSAINQLEMWQAESFDPAANDRELGFAQRLGFTSVRVYLHDIPWQQDAKGFLDRLDRFLAIADRHKIGVLFTLFDSCWDPVPKPGRQRDPKPHVHNSGWVQSPGLEILKDPARHDSLKDYVVGVVGRFRDDRRVHAWDLFNEPDNRNDPAYVKDEPGNKADLALPLLRKAFAWAREAKPTQPLCSGIWWGDWSDDGKLSPMQRVQVEASDVINFHCYGNLDDMRRRVEWLKRYNRPLLCTEYMARVNGSTFQAILPYLKEQKVAAYNWGFVAGKTQTIYPWDSWRKAYTAEPPVWFHDILRQDGTPYDPKEVEVIRSLTGAGR